ncbi:hypothetical protein BDV30DRAFT_246988 [Aspergillus minisclerotigenes]|uniref:Uncharacterized protein n=1 Tax=Aspergillus minisclerotigenes TaxID=656917 RepID=A0A5N6ILJ4_9EURO|nr:hypothetical protein BDV30DRAFT_246988 [Aspergillus minisclerotigenes]
MADIPYLFTKREETINTWNWYSYLSKSPQTYKDCVELDGVRRSRLLSPSSHGSGSSSSGSKSSSSSSSSGGGDLPLPLWSLKFNSGSLNVVDLAEILRNATHEGGDYNLLNRNCYWFAATAYASVRGQLILFKNAAKPNAESFDQERKNKWEYAPGKPVSKWEFFERAYKETIRLEVDDEEEAKKQIEEHADEWINNDIDNNTSFSALPEWGSGKPFKDFEIDEVHERVFDDGNAESYKKVYDRYNQAKPAPKPLPEDSEEISIPEELVVLEPTENQKQKMDQAIEVMVGRVLAEYQKNYPN